MAKLLNTTFLTSQPAPSTPSSGFGTLYASGSGLYFKNSSGVNYDLLTVGSSSIRAYTSSANWSKPPNIQYIKVVCAGGGGGGGSGRTAPGLATTTAGGQGGCGGNINIAYFSASALTGDTYTVNIGIGGTGGLRYSSSIGSFGSPGTAGLSSSFATGSGANFTRLLSALGGPGGVGGGTGTANANVQPTTAQVPNPYPPFYFCGVNTPVNTDPPSNSSASLSGTFWLAGGGHGGRLSPLNASGSGASGSAIYLYNVLTPSGSPSLPATTVDALPGDNGAPVLDIAQLLFYSGSNITTGVRIGTGGHGGGSGKRVAPLLSAGNGGSGSLGAGGGGGGGASTGSIASPIFAGGGGPGGNGFVLIFEYY